MMDIYKMQYFYRSRYLVSKEMGNHLYSKLYNSSSSDSCNLLINFRQSIDFGKLR